MFLLGLRIGIITTVSTQDFEFWYLASMYMIKKIFGSTNLFYLLVRKFLYSIFPNNLKHHVSMNEIPDHRKGSEGFCLESLLWIGFYYWWWGTNTIVIPEIKNGYILVDDYEFTAKTLFKNVYWDRPLFAWIFIAIG
jgi:hypothetical protein